MRGTALALFTASIFSLAACGGDDASNTAGSSGTGGTGGSGGTAGAGGSAAGNAGTSGSGGGGTAGTTPGDASTGTDVRADTPTGTPDAPVDRGSTQDAPATDGGSPGDVARDTTPTPDAPPMDTSSPPDGGQPDTAPPTDGSTGDATSDAPVGDGSATMVLTSTAFTEGMMIPAAHTCAGTNVSPPLSWTPGPAGTLSYAVVLTDKTNNLVHAGIYDIPASLTSLPMNVDKVAMPSNPAGSKQVQAYNSMPGYAGPCPGATAHTYEFMLYAVDIAVLPGVTTTQKGAALVTALQAHDLATTTLTGSATSVR